MTATTSHERLKFLDDHDKPAALAVLISRQRATAMLVASTMRKDAGIVNHILLVLLLKYMTHL